jgi:hypothetical protein
VPNTYPEIVADPEPLATDAAPRPHWTRWPKWILLLVVFSWLAGACLSLLIQHTSLKRKLTSHLETAFGRSVEVGSYDFSLWSGPVLEANSVTVAEDARFGNEYFLRADSLSVGLRWQSLLRGRLELGTLSLTRPSLNIVAEPDGDWNLAEWLPRPAAASAATPPGKPPAQQNAAPASSTPSLRFSKVEVDGGRINFKRGDLKLPFAFIDVEGTVDTESPGRWNIDLKATPWRAAILLQQTGTLHLSANVGGTSSRLLPATVDLSWADASVSDVLRLARQDDLGIRGTLDLQLSASGEQSFPASSWTVQGRAQMRELHRWDLSLRQDNPSLNLIAALKWQPGSQSLDITQATFETPQSNAHLAGAISWAPPPKKSEKPAISVPLQVTSSAIDLGDALAWLRAFRSGVADDVSVRGVAKVQTVLSSWPPRLLVATVETGGADLTGASIRTPIHMGRLEYHYDPSGWSLLPVTLSFGPLSTGSPSSTNTPLSGPRNGSPNRNPVGLSDSLPNGHVGGLPNSQLDGQLDGLLRIDVASHSKSAKPKSPLLGWHVAGGSSHIEDIFAAVGAFGWNLTRGWTLAGPFRCDLRWMGTDLPPHALPIGFIEFGPPSVSSVNVAKRIVGKASAGAPPVLLPLADSTGATLRVPFLNLPVTGIQGRADLKPGASHIALSSAQVFGAHWNGTLDRRASDPGWQFVLAADRLDAADLDRWLNPRWRESFLGRMLPCLNSAPGAAAASEILNAKGTLKVDQFALAPVVVRHLAGTVELAGRRIALSRAHGDFYGGEVDGIFAADLQPVPSYSMSLDFSRVDLAAITNASPHLANLFAGSVSGRVSFKAHGTTRSDLLSGLSCQGTADLTSPQLLAMDLEKSLRAASLIQGTSEFRAGSAAFSCADSGIRFESLSLVGADSQIDGAGRYDFSRNLDMRLSFVSPANSVAAPLAADSAAPNSSPIEMPLDLTGPLSAPVISKNSPSSRRSR